MYNKRFQKGSNAYVYNEPKIVNTVGTMWL